MARATGLTEVNLRAWEHRYGFPTPDREASGHRRYAPAEVDRILRVLDERKRGIGIQAAIERVCALRAEVPSLFATLRRRRPDLRTMTMKKAHLLNLCRAIEDESLARAEPRVLIGAFQRERFYRQSEERWRELSRGSVAALVFADFDRSRSPADAPVEVPLVRSHPLNREWALVCLAPGHVACLVGWEPPAQHAGGDSARRFEAVFSLEPRVAREAAEVALGVAEPAVPEVARDVRNRLEELVEPSTESQLRLATDITARMVSLLS